MKQALILCGGEARRLRPYSHALPKAGMPFLNLPLMAFNWLYLELLGVSHFLLNAHLFPEKLRRAVEFLSLERQRAKIFREDRPFGGAGTLYNLRRLFGARGPVFLFKWGQPVFSLQPKTAFCL